MHALFNNETERKKHDGGDTTKDGKSHAAQNNALLAWGVQAVYAFSARESIEVVQADGSVEKKAIFRHKGFFHL